MQVRGGAAQPSTLDPQSRGLLAGRSRRSMTSAGGGNAAASMMADATSTGSRKRSPS